MAECREGLCERCGNDYPMPWYAPNHLWNAAIRGGNRGGEENGEGFLCPSCFMTLAEERRAVRLPIWRVDLGHQEADERIVRLETALREILGYHADDGLTNEQALDYIEDAAQRALRATDSTGGSDGGS